MFLRCSSAPPQWQEGRQQTNVIVVMEGENRGCWELFWFFANISLKTSPSLPILSSFGKLYKQIYLNHNYKRSSQPVTIASKTSTRLQRPKAGSIKPSYQMQMCIERKSFWAAVCFADFWMIKTQSRDPYACVSCCKKSAGDTFVSSFGLVSVRGSHKRDVTT